MSTLPESLDSFRQFAASVLLEAARESHDDADRLDKFAAMAAQASTRREVLVILDSAGLGLSKPGATAPPPHPALRERLTDVLGALAFGLCPPEECKTCRPGSQCGPCAAATANVRTVNIATLEAQYAETGGEALAAYVRCFLELTGIPEADWRVGIAASGGAR